jgi:hypothetical protein
MGRRIHRGGQAASRKLCASTRPIGPALSRTDAAQKRSRPGIHTPNCANSAERTMEARALRDTEPRYSEL